MHKISTALALLSGVFLGHCTVASADAFKCVDPQGRVTFAQVPCPPEQGQASWAASTARTRLYSLNPDEDTPQKLNEKALKILQSGYNVKYNYKVERIVTTEPPPPPKLENRPRPAYKACNSAENARYCNH